MSDNTADTIEQLRAIRRVLELVDGYISTQNPNLLLSWGGGVMTWGELRWHIRTALDFNVLDFGDK